MFEANNAPVLRAFFSSGASEVQIVVEADLRHQAIADHRLLAGHSPRLYLQNAMSSSQKRYSNEHTAVKDLARTRSCCAG